MERKSDGDSNCNWSARNSYQVISIGTEVPTDKKRSGDHPNYSVIGIGQNTEKSSGDLRRLAVTQSTVENHQLKSQMSNIIMTEVNNYY